MLRQAPSLPSRLCARSFSASSLALRAAPAAPASSSRRSNAGSGHYAQRSRAAEGGGERSQRHPNRRGGGGGPQRGGGYFGGRGGAGGRGQGFNARAGGANKAGPSSISTAQLVNKLAHHLETVWAKPGAPARELRQLGADIGVEPRRLAQLANQFARDAQPSLSTRSAEGHTGIEWDLEAIRAAYVSDGNEALFNATLATFLAWVRVQVPLPTPTPTQPVPDAALSKLHQLAAIADRRFAYEDFPDARQRRRRLILHVGPTNSGKTHSALVALARARTGAYAGPLRLLAHEVFSRFNEGKIGDEGKRTCNLVTGEEQRILDPDAGLQSCTVEMFPLSKRLDVGVVDEIQMIGDPQRGTAWTSAVIGSLCDELHLCGEESVVELVQKIAAELGDECIVKRYQRLSPLVVAEASLGGDLSRIRKGDCLVTFSRSNIFAFKRAVEEKTGLRVAVAYGGLPPEVREEQARAFNEGNYDVLVASDAVGMGLNLKIRRIVFESLHKWDGRQEIRLPTPQIKQIAGRAGRYGVHTPVSPSAPDLDPAEETKSEGVLGEATTLDAVDLPILQEAMRQPTVQVTQASLSAPFDSFKALFALLPPTTPLSRIFALSRAITRTKPHYRATGTVQLGEVGDKIADVKPLTFFERYTFGLAPVNTRDALVVDTLIRFAESYARGEKILMEQWGEEMGIYGLLDRVADAATQQKLARDSPPEWTPAALTRRQAAVFTPQMLQSLESYHRCLTLYLWLSYRLAPIFCDQPAARELRNRVEKAIETALAGIRFERVDRSKGAKRNKARVATPPPPPQDEAGRPLDFLSMLEKQV
ncbi:hypothetical protein JCM10908_003909 [Rhodotorula pacifica]|uniref:ATP-dependent RNA helicase SUV3 n=1 Tax=Rhodotorula pacifica TaxID=1495444 RepID=UPI00316E1A4B